MEALGSELTPGEEYPRKPLTEGTTEMAGSTISPRWSTSYISVPPGRVWNHSRHGYKRKACSRENKEWLRRETPKFAKNKTNMTSRGHLTWREGTIRGSSYASGLRTVSTARPLPGWSRAMGSLTPRGSSHARGEERRRTKEDDLPSGGRDPSP